MKSGLHSHDVVGNMPCVVMAVRCSSRVKLDAVSRRRALLLAVFAENNKNPKAAAKPLDEAFAQESLADELDEIITCIMFGPWSEPDEKMPDEQFEMPSNH
jgi:hypothetical protein